MSLLKLSLRAVVVVGLAAALFSALSARPVTTGAAALPAQRVGGRPAHDWGRCNSSGVAETPHVVWVRIHTTAGRAGIPLSYWRNDTYRHDIAKIICYESTFEYHAAGPGQYGWFQMSKPLIYSERVSWSKYWSGGKKKPAGWYQCIAGGRYVVQRYKTPVAAWAHEEDYGWY